MEHLFLSQTALFEGVDPSEISAMLNCLSAVEKTYRKNATLVEEGDAAGKIGIVRSGKLAVKKIDYYGNETVITEIGPGGIFGEVFACAQVPAYPVTVTAMETSAVVLLDYSRIIQNCENTCPFHSRLVFNMLRIMAERNLLLNSRIEMLSRRTIREKLLAYLTAEAARTGQSAFESPFNRQALADYLCVDRSALSRELSQMQRDGLIRFEKSRFELLRQEGQPADPPAG